MRCFTVLAAIFAASTSARLVRHDENFRPDIVLEATQQETHDGCFQRTSVVMNGSLVGPPIYLREGEATWVRVYNRMSNLNLTMHWHGLSQRAAPFSDGTPMVSQWPIPPLHFFDYEVKSEIGDAGTYFYHSHVGFQQITATGAIIVLDRNTPPYHYDEDLIWSMGDFYIKDDTVMQDGLLANPFVWTGEPVAFSINGRSGTTSFQNGTDETCKPLVIDVEPDKTYRIRTINRASLSLVKVGIEDHPELTVIEADGEYTTPFTTDHMQLSPGQRFSYLLRAKSEVELQKLNKREFWVRYQTYDRPTTHQGYALIRYVDRARKNVPALPASLPSTSPVTLSASTNNYLEGVLSPYYEKVRQAFPRLSEVTRTVTIVVKQQLLNGAWKNGAPDGNLVWGQDGHTWSENVEAGQLKSPYLVSFYNGGRTPNYTAAIADQGFDPTTRVFPAKVGEVLDIVWENDDGESGGFDFHPFHNHGKHVYDLGSGNGTYDACENEKRFENGYVPARRDTTNLYRYSATGAKNTTAGWRAWRIRVTEEDVGAWMMHCHIAQHAVMGMNTIWVYGDEADIKKRFPDLPYSKGYLTYGGSAYGNFSHAPMVNHYFEGH